MVYETPEYHPAFEEYCEAVFELAEDDFNVIQARIADRLEVSRPAVSAMIRRFPIRIARRACPSVLLILCAPVWFRSSRLR